MTERDRRAIFLRNGLLIIPLALIANMWRNPTGLLHYAEILIIALCLVFRERVSYAWWKRGVGTETTEKK